jgi:hypothetical protein
MSDSNPEGWKEQVYAAFEIKSSSLHTENIKKIV